MGRIINMLGWTDLKANACKCLGIKIVLYKCALRIKQLVEEDKTETAFREISCCDF